MTLSASDLKSLAVTQVSQVSQVGSGAKLSVVGGSVSALVITFIWNAVVPQNPMPPEVAGALGSLTSTGLYLLGDYLASRKVSLPTPVAPEFPEKTPGA